MSRNSKYKKLAVNSVTFAAANFGSSILRFIIVPFYTYFMTTVEYGTVDILTTTVSLVLPIFLMAINEAVLRYTLKKKVDNSRIIMSSFFVMFIGAIVFIPSYFICGLINIEKGLWGYFYVLLIVQGLYNILLNYTRGIGKSIFFAVAGILNTVVLLGSNVLLLAGFRMGLTGYMVSLLLSFIIADAFLLFVDRKTFHFSVKAIDFHLLRQMMKYSIPLIPTAMMWWVMNASDRYVITWVLGVSATGIYAVSHKIPTVINMLYSIFQQAWQVSAVEEGNSQGREKFYSNIYGLFCSALFIASSIIILIDKPLIQFVVSSNYEDAWKYVPFLIISAIFSSLAGFLGINYVVAEKTIGAFVTSAITAAINWGLNIVLTPLIGMQGTALATLIGFAVLWLIRSVDTQKYIKYEQNYLKIGIQTVILIIQSLILISDFKFSYILQCVLFAGIVAINYKSIASTIRAAKTFIGSLFHKKKIHSK